jgi:threonine aldolase
MADWCEENGVEHDRYGDGDLIEHFEQKIAALLGKPAAIFLPSGTMAQLIAVRIWTERRRAGLSVSTSRPIWNITKRRLIKHSCGCRA